MIDIQTQFGVSLFIALMILIILLGMVFLIWVLYDKMRERKKKGNIEEHGAGSADRKAVLR